MIEYGPFRTNSGSKSLTLDMEPNLLHRRAEVKYSGVIWIQICHIDVPRLNAREVFRNHSLVVRDACTIFFNLKPNKFPSMVGYPAPCSNSPQSECKEKFFPPNFFFTSEFFEASDYEFVEFTEESKIYFCELLTSCHVAQFWPLSTKGVSWGRSVTKT